MEKYVKTFEDYLNEDDTHGKFVAIKKVSYKDGDGNVLIIEPDESLSTDYVKGQPKSVTVSSGDVKDMKVPKDWVRGLINKKTIKKLNEGLSKTGASTLERFTQAVSDTDDDKIIDAWYEIYDSPKYKNDEKGLLKQANNFLVKHSKIKYFKGLKTK